MPQTPPALCHTDPGWLDSETGTAAQILLSDAAMRSDVGADDDNCVTSASGMKSADRVAPAKE